MKFSRLYKDNRESVEQALRALWCGESGNESQRAYSKHLGETIKELFAPEDAVPLVQCMNSYEPVHSVTADEAKALVGGLWTKGYAPYEHQYRCWKTLLEDKSADGKPMSVCVTTGTGSGKTECFMMPLVRDLIDKGKKDQVQAIFLYPLNALMEDQKERLEELLEGTDLTYTVYNGDLPEDEPDEGDTSGTASRIRKRIASLRGFDETTGECKYKHLIYTRKMVRKSPPNILLTNPTMLEYILLRDKDATLTNPELKSLSWIAIDETHSYTGAGAAELAMLLRRVLLAFGVKAVDLHFATSSATFGNGSDPEKEEQQLKSFIAGITGIDTGQVAVIGGKRTGEDDVPENEDSGRWRRLLHDEYAKLDELFTDGRNVGEKLALLDDMCERVPTRDGTPLLKAKVHYFYRVPNNGLFVRLTEHHDGVFKIYTQNNVNEDSKENPLLELCRCKHCGEYVALAQLNIQPGEDYMRYRAASRDERDMFDIEADDDEAAVMNYVVVGLKKGENERGDNNISVRAVNGKLESSAGEADTGDWHLVANTHCRCPQCNSRITRSHDSDESSLADDLTDGETAYLQKFRTSSELISRIMASSVLDNLDKVTADDSGKTVLHDGQQYISFADSRQLAAKATLKQNLEQERYWVYSTVYHELCKRKAEAPEIDAEIDRLDDERERYRKDRRKRRELNDKIDELEELRKPYMTWEEIASLLKGDKYCKVFCSLFVKRSSDSDELTGDGSLKTTVIEKYVQSIMVMYLTKRPASAAAPETLGLFCTHYPQIEDISLPEAVEAFNSLLGNEDNKIALDDWRSLLQVFMDYTVRSNQSVFLKLSDTNPIDIFSCERFATEKPHRRPVNKPIVEQKTVSQSRIVRYLCQLLAQDKGMSANDAYRTCFKEISQVMDALWEDVTRQDAGLLEQSQHWDEESRSFVNDKDVALRLNLKNLCFKLYEDVYLCDTNTDSSVKHTQCLRPVENKFKGFSPYLKGNVAVKLKEELHEKWEAYPYYKGSGSEADCGMVREWAKEHRRLLWENHLWGDDGAFMNRLMNIHIGPNLFIQAEHTAQVDKDVARTLQNDFKEHTVNILACSTTMEMGVDLGNLEVVMLTSVPPLPSNYKQRAGRSGRNNKVQSACITLCGSDAVGLRTLYDPINKLINRAVQVPMIDLMSPQVVQRHVNSYLIRAFGVFKEGECGGRLTQAVFNYYSNFVGRKEGEKKIIVKLSNNVEVSPNDKLGEKDGTMYATFNQSCMEALPDKVREDLKELLRGTVFEGHSEYVVEKALEANKRCYQELNTRLEDLQVAFIGAKDKFRTKLKMQYYEVLLSRLLTFWATNRFTPNANMPVNVLTLDLNTTGKQKGYAPSGSSNPSYGLREAISQYVPGNSIVVDGVVYIVRGIEFTNMYQSNARSFKKIYHNQDKCTVDNDTIDSKMKWRANEDYALELVQPVGFVPDMNEDKSRIMDDNRYTHVSAQLIDTTDWADNVTEPHLFSVRSNRQSGDAKILYYNEGTGYGYCLCSRCGRMALETGAANPEDRLDNLPVEMNNRKPKEEGKHYYHFEIFGKDFRRACYGSSNKDLIRRNVIIGDLLQTDFSEIRIRHKGQKSWLGNLSGEKERRLMFTLGIVFTQALLDILGKERGAVDFTVMPNGHICLFDTNPGGAGYANQMTSIPLMKEVITASKRMLLDAQSRNSKDLLLNKFTLRYIDNIDIESALDWINEEEEARGILPEEIAYVSKDSAETSLANMQEAFLSNEKEAVFFVNDKYSEWDYDSEEHGWKNHFLSRLRVHSGMTRLCIAKTEGSAMPEPIVQMLRSAKDGWAKDVQQMASPYAGRQVYPIAYIGNVLYFTNSVDNSALNDVWGNGTLYCARVDDISGEAASVDTSYKDSTKLFILKGESCSVIKTNELGGIIQKLSGGIVDDFIAHCKSHEGKLKVTYQDEHLKSVMGMVLTLQTIGHYIVQTGKDFEIEFLVEEYKENFYKGYVSSNLENSKRRDEKLTRLTEDWAGRLKSDYGISGSLVPIRSAHYNTLTHWRVLSLECGGKRLSIYPDGGFANGWNLLKDWSVNKKKFTIENTTAADVIALQRSKEIKFDVVIEDVLL